jgi:hypothetical protein
VSKLDLIAADFIWGLAWNVYVFGWHESALAHCPELCQTPWELMEEWGELCGF